jgi:hypothetical protein
LDVIFTSFLHYVGIGEQLPAQKDAWLYGVDGLREDKPVCVPSHEHSDEPPNAKIVFTNGFNDFCVSSPYA